MSEPKFTPGPWRLYSRLGVVAVHKDGTAIPVVAWPGFDSAGVGGPHVNEHNAQLIAAAPDLYAALRAIDEHWQNGNFSRDPALWEPMRAALAKAVGT